MVVVFPAPFGPKKPKISPEFTEKLILSTAKTSVLSFLFINFLLKFSTWIISVIMSVSLKI